MMKFGEFLEEEKVDYIILMLPVEAIPKEMFLNEGNWIDSKKKGYSYRIDAENPQLKLQRHVHIAKKKHIKSKTQQVSWNQDATKHDKKTFNSKLASSKVVQSIAKDALGLSPSLELEESLESFNLCNQINESSEYINVYNLKLLD